MAKRIQLSTGASEPYQHLLGLHRMVEKAAADAGLDQRLLELVKIRASMLNGCAFCLDMHARDARRLGESDTVINTFNRLGVTSRKPLPARP
jgi:AhpD family alkylhydroperoxidase